MGSTKCRRAGVVAALAASLTMMGGTAFASSSAPADYQEPVNPGGLLGGIYATMVTTIADNSRYM